MTGSTEIVHVAWGVSRADSIRDALRALGCDQRVISLPHALNVGPIDPPDPAARRSWARANLRDDDPDRRWDEPEAPWSEATAPDIYPVYWVCLSDAGEHASYLAFVSRMVDRSFDIVDATGIAVSAVGGFSPIWSLGQLRPEEIVASGLHASRRPIARVEAEAAMAVWSRLQRENAPLRVVRGGCLVSAPLAHFDPVLIQQATSGWEPVIKLIARALNHLSVETDPPGQGPGCEFLFARVLALGEAGVFEIRGAGPSMRELEVQALRWSPVVGQDLSVAKLNSGCCQAASLSILAAPYASSGVRPARAE